MSTIEKHDMTQGKILLPLVSFTIPLVLGNLFQLTYNAADSVIVGKYVGEQALAAVGTSTPIMNIAILLISGMCMGASVLMSSQYGAKDYDTLSRQISTTMLAGCGFSVVFSLLMLLLANPVLRLIRVPETAIPEAAAYLRIIFMGLIFTFMYNFLANTMRALGDSKTPLYFLEAMWVWNDYLLPTLVLDIKKYKTIPMLIQYFRGSYGKVEMGPMMASIMLTVIPIVIVYLLGQKHIIKGVAAGAVKG